LTAYLSSLRRSERPRGRAAEQRDELSPFQLIELHLTLNEAGPHRKIPQFAGIGQEVMERFYNPLHAAAPAYRKPWIAFARQKFTRSGFDECSNHLN
jgi:hypothetical protein